MTLDERLRRAAHLLQSGDVAAATAAHRDLLALEPNLPDSWYNLAYLQRCARDFESALASYQQALTRGVGQPEEVHLNRAVILSEYLERGPEAEAELRQALRLNPRFALAWLNLGNLYEDWGDPAQARAAYQRALEVVPGNGRALARIAAIDTFQGKAAQIIPELRRALASPDLSLEDAAEVAFALGNALDAVGAYDEAFATFVRANRASRESAPPPGVHYHRHAEERLVDELIRVFAKPVSASAQSDGKPPIFICGMFRSGSTLAEQILARHSRVTPGGELDFLPALVAERLQPYPASLLSAPPEAFEQLRGEYLQRLESLHPGAEVVTDKRPDNFLHIGLIKFLFPDAKIVHTRRNPLDNLLSVYFLHFQHSISYGLDLKDAAHWYRQYLRLMEHWKRLYGSDIHDFDYDAAVADPRPEIEGLLRFCGLEWEEACLASHAAANPVRTASVWQVRQPLHQRSSGRWRNYERHLEESRKIVEAPL